MISHTVQLIRRLCCISALVLMIFGCSSQPVYDAPRVTSPAVVANPAPVKSTADQAVSIALRQIGVPYRYGGSTPRGFDCSGLVHYSYSRAGKHVPRTTATLWDNTQPVAVDQIRRGDILFFRISGKMSHVGMYIGGGKFVHAPSSGKTVSVASLRSDFYSEALIRAGRPE